MKKNLPHPGFIVVDSPLTSHKEGRDRPVAEDDASDEAESKIDPTIENGFWVSLTKLPKDIQIIVLDNKEPPDSIAASIEYQYFAGRKWIEGQRRGFLPAILS